MTTEIAVSPAGAALDDFDWRVSMAFVESGGPFSEFSGVDRSLAVLEGEGMILDIAGRPAATVTKTSAPLSFPADVPTQAALIAGPITDLNVMTRRGRMSHAVDRLVISASTDIQSAADATLILCVHGEITVAGAAPVRIGPRDALLLGPDALKRRIEPARPATLFVIRIERIAAND